MKKEVVFENEVNSELGKLLDWLNLEYGFEVYKEENGMYVRHDLQCGDIEHNYSLNDIIQFYIVSYENILDCVHADGDNNPRLESELAILKKYYKK